ncbi:MAG: hypothetical protein ACKOOH_02460, partial [Cyanobium sp.]
MPVAEPHPTPESASDREAGASAGAPSRGLELDQLPRLLPVAVVAGLTALWAVSPSIPVKVRGSGLLTSPESRRAFFARGPGQVQDLKVRVGSEVVAGQLLLTLSR